jgi:hypothetical protein
LPAPRLILAQSPFFCPSLRLRSFPECSQSGNEKGNLSYLAIIKQCARFDFNAKKEREHIK